MQLEGFGHVKNPVKSQVIKPATFWLVAYCHNQLRYRVSSFEKSSVDMEILG
jgi:hypothetical protein